jgi:hypothetical protein
MSENRNDLRYQGPDRDYEAGPGSNTEVINPLPPVQDGEYYNFDNLASQLDLIIQQTNLIEDKSTVELSKFNLKINNEKLLEAQNVIWPETIPDVKNYVTYNEYKALEPRTDRASKYIKDAYKDSIRGEEGSGLFDIKKLAKILNVEAKSVKGFIDAYNQASVDDSAQSRIQELFQDWASSSLRHTGRLLSFFEKGKQANTSKIPEPQMATISESDAVRYQALFKARINAVNLEIDRELSNFERHFLNSSDVFYNKFLGPSLKFHLNAGRDLAVMGNDNTLLGAEAAKVNESLYINMETALLDLFHRSEIFDLKISTIEDRIGRRESLKEIFKQMSQKSGVTATVFISEIPDLPSDRSLVKELETQNTVQQSISGLFSSHNSLTGREAADAHPQYLLKSGGEVTGDISVDSGIKIDGVDFSAHAHTGLDGSTKISGTSILEGTLETSVVDVSESVPKPVDLKLIGFQEGGQSGDVTLLSAQFNWGSLDENQIYEVQITKRDSATS